MIKNPPGRPRENLSKKPIAKRVLALKAKGLSFSQIGEKIGATKQWAHYVHSRCIAEKDT